MKHPEKWRDTVDPFLLPYRSFEPKRVIGYPHAGNDVFQMAGIYQGREVEAFVKVARQRGADIQREADTIAALGWALAPQVIDFGTEEPPFLVTLAKEGERLSTLYAAEPNLPIMDCLYEYGQTLARLHQTAGQFEAVKDRSYFHTPPKERLAAQGLSFVYDYLVAHAPTEVHSCFCHGDFHYANLLWKDNHISAILDFELSGIGNREFDIAWAVILRLGQQFLRSEAELERFLEGYSSVGTFDPKLVKYYMILIYSRFYGIENREYREYVMEFLRQGAGNKGGK